MLDIASTTLAYEQIESSRHAELRLELIRAAVAYTRYRVEWRLLSPEERRETGSARTAAHNAFIDACNIMSRNMAQSGEPTGWRRMLGDDRQDIGDLACFICLFLGLAAR